MKAIGYCRSSNLTGSDESASFEMQDAGIRAWCAQNKMELESVFCETVSGKAPLEERKVLMDALTYAVANGVTHLVVWKRNRLARESFVAQLIERTLEAKGVQVVSTEGNNGDSPEETLMRGILDLFAQYERTQVVLRLAMGKASARNAGRFVGGWTPFGCIKDAEGNLTLDEARRDAICAVLGGKTGGLHHEQVRRIRAKRDIYLRLLAEEQPHDA